MSSKNKKGKKKDAAPEEEAKTSYSGSSINLGEYSLHVPFLFTLKHCHT